MVRHLRRRLLAGLVLGFVIILGLGLYSDLNEVGGHLAGFNWKLLPLILGGTLFNYTLRFFKWHYYLGLIGVRDIPWPDSLRLFLAGFPLAVTPGKAGEALKAVWLRNESGTPIARGVTVVLAERISDGLAVLALSSLGVIAYPRYWPAFATILLVLLLGIILSQNRSASLWLIQRAEILPIVKRFSASVRSFYEGAYTLFRPLPTLTAVSLGIVAWLGEGLALYWVLVGLGVAASIQTAAIAIFVLSFSTVVGAISALPGGLGAAEMSIAGMLSLLLGLSPSTVTTATLLIRLATLWFGVAIGFAVWSISRDMFFKDSEAAEPSGNPDTPAERNLHSRMPNDQTQR